MRCAEQRRKLAMAQGRLPIAADSGGMSALQTFHTPIPNLPFPPHPPQPPLPLIPTAQEDGRFSHFELVYCKCVDTYVRVKQNQNQVCWKWVKVRRAGQENTGRDVR